MVLSGIAVSKETILTMTFNTIIQNENIASNGQGPLLQTWINFNPSMDKYTSNHLLSNMWDKITYPFPNFNGCTVEIWEWISNFIPQFMMDVIMHAGIKVNPYYQKEP